MRRKFDFVLFENAYAVENHYKDLGILAVILKEAGYKVAIANVFKEKELCNPEGIEHVDFEEKAPSYFTSTGDKKKKVSSIINLYYRLREDRYLSYIIKECGKVTSNIYLGSLTLGLPTLFLSNLDKDVNYYVWGLRSITPLRWKFESKGFYNCVSRRLYNSITQNDNIKIVVSNEIIRNEFINNVGIPEGRIILRPERVIDEKPRFVPSTPGKLNLLYIGTLRSFKRVEMCVEAMRRLNNSNIHYTIAGRCRDGSGYDKLIENRIKGLSNVTRIDRYISDEEYEDMLKSCDCLVLCDKPQESCASNGTMLEAVLHGKPIIAPDFNPFKFEIEKYHIGYLYKEGDVDSLCSALLQILNNGTSSLEISIDKYIQMHLIKSVSGNVKKQIGRHEESH
jgi:glycosyltransferase involved in cell wall biosynthesis